MAKNYDDYGYDDDRNRSSGLARKLLIIIMIVIAILLILYLTKSCNNGKNKKNNTDNNTVSKYDYEGEILKAGKNYFETHKDEAPNAPGECSVVELQKLLENNLVDADRFGSCNVTTSYLRMCILENGTKHYTPWVTCVNTKSDEMYESLKEGTASDIVANKTYVEFKFLAQKVSASNEILGDVQELWQDEIKYDSYKTLATTKYYRYRDKLFTWNLTNRYYYTSAGEVNGANQTNEYYVTAPSSQYKYSSDKTTEAYKWYKSESEKEYYMKNGSKYPSPTPIDGYPLRDPVGIDVTRYRTRTVTGTYAPTKYYGCATSASSPNIIYQKNTCGTGTHTEYNYQREIIYSCVNNESDGSLIRANKVDGPNSTCYSYSAWTSASETPCDTSKPNVCQSVTVTFYYWYRVVNETRLYYPSNSTKASGEKVYYKEAPFKDAIKDTSTVATAYKWYREVKTTTSNFSAVAPSGYTTATRTSEYKYSDWSDWSTKNPKVNDGRDRSIETKVKIKLQEIKGKTEEAWQNISDDYLTEEGLIKLYNEKGYNVKTLEDIVNNGEIKYRLKLFIRNKKESM